MRLDLIRPLHRPHLPPPSFLTSAALDMNGEFTGTLQAVLNV
jgi:hypothetical protein